MNVNRLIRNALKYKKKYGGDKLIYINCNDGLLDCDFGNKEPNKLILNAIDPTPPESMECPKCGNIAHWYENFGAFVCLQCPKPKVQETKNESPFGRKRTSIPRKLKLDTVPKIELPIVFGRKFKTNKQMRSCYD